MAGVAREAGLLGEGDVAHRLLRARLLAHHRGSRSGSWRSSLLFERARYGGQVLFAETLINGMLPFVS